MSVTTKNTPLLKRIARRVVNRTRAIVLGCTRRWGLAVMTVVISLALLVKFRPENIMKTIAGQWALRHPDYATNFGTILTFVVVAFALYWIGTGLRRIWK